MASQNPEIAEALAFFRAKKYAYASPMDVARALGEDTRSSSVASIYRAWQREVQASKQQ